MKLSKINQNWNIESLKSTGMTSTAIIEIFQGFLEFIINHWTSVCNDSWTNFLKNLRKKDEEKFRRLNSKLSKVTKAPKVDEDILKKYLLDSVFLL
jgi:hypothetical protein